MDIKTVQWLNTKIKDRDIRTFDISKLLIKVQMVKKEHVNAIKSHVDHLFPIEHVRVQNSCLMYFILF